MEARPPLLVLAVVGRKGAGKTRVVEGLVRELRARGLKVATAKHVPEEGFSLDKPGKDSWRHAEAGAEAVTLVAPGEVATIRRLRGRQPGLEDVLAWASCGCDVLIMEGFSTMAGEAREVLKVVVARGLEEARELLAGRQVRPVLAFVVPEKGAWVEELGRPAFTFEELDELADMLAELARRRAEARARKEAELFLAGREVPLKPFVRELLRSLVLAFISCLRGVEVKGDERVKILVERP